jgi:hypothetical protein
MGVLAFITDIFKPAAKLIDDLHTSDEERLSVKKELVNVENQLSLKILEYESKLVDAQASIIRAEATGQSWIQRNWRPITMLTFLVLVVLDTFGIFQSKLNPKAWLLLQIGLGGYVVGRSAEKIIPKLIKRKDEVAKG